MKRGIVLLALVSLFFLSLVSLSAQENQTQIDNAYSCLEDKTQDCSSLSTQEKTFTALATGQCVSELESDSSNNECWPSGNCNVKSTAQATLALDRVGSSTNSSESWLLSQTQNTDNLIWYLQVESNDAASCTVSYNNDSYDLSIDEDKTVSGSFGNCLSVSNNDYWLEVSPSCYGTEFSVSCDAGFLTNQLYEEQGSPTIYVSGSSNSASAEGTVTETVESSCFGVGSCDYEGSLWAALVLDFLGYDISSYMPYLITGSDETENQEYLPSAFLYSLTSSEEFKTELLGEQKIVNEQSYWEESGNRYYDTAVALYPFQYESPQEITDSKDWLLSVQGEEGCWNSGNIRDTAFILYSVWPQSISGGETVNCQAAGYYCMSGLDCVESGGEVLNDYSCSGTFSCCTQQKVIPTCSEQGGEICSSDESCVDGGTTVSASDASSDEVCCVSGSCEVVEQEPSVNECEAAGGTCRISCNSGEEESYQACEFSNDKCCIQETGGGSYWWLWVLGILIILVVFGIIFRDKLRKVLFKIRSKFGKGKGKKGPKGPGPGRPRGPGRPPGRPPSGPRPPLGPASPGQGPAPRKRPTRTTSSQGEVNDVLKKLKEMGK